MNLPLLLMILSLLLFFGGLILLGSKKRGEKKIYAFGASFSLAGFLLFGVSSFLFFGRTFEKDNVLYAYLCAASATLSFSGLLFDPLIRYFQSWKWNKSIGYAVFFVFAACFLAFAVILSLSVIQNGAGSSSL